MASKLLRYPRNKAFVTDRKLDLLSAKPVVSHSSHQHQEIVKIGASPEQIDASSGQIDASSGQIGFGQGPVRFRIPNIGVVDDCYLELNISDVGTSGAWTDSWGLIAIQKLKIEVGSEILTNEQDHDALINWRLANSRAEQRKLLYEISDTQGGAGKCIAPIFTPWSSSWMKDTVAGLPAHSIAGDIWITLWFSTRAQLVADGITDGSETLTGELHVKRTLTEGNVNRNKPWMIKTVSFKQGPSRSLAAGVQARFNMNHITGAVSEIMFLTRNDNDFLSNNRLIKADLDTLDIYVDSDRIESYTGFNEMLMTMQIDRDYELDRESLSGVEVRDPFIWGTSSHVSYVSILGQFHSANGTNLEYGATTSEDATIKAIGVMHAFYVLKDGGVVRKE